MGARADFLNGKYYGSGEAITACDEKLGELAARVECEVSGPLPYDEKEAFKISPQSEARRRKALEKQAAALGLTLQPATV